MNATEWIFYRNQLRDYLASKEGLKLSHERRKKFEEEIGRVQHHINELLGLLNTDESVIANYNYENEIQ